MKNFCALIGKYFGLLAVAFLVLGFMDPGLFRPEPAPWCCYVWDGDHPVP